MADNPRSIRVTDQQAKFLDSGYELSANARDWLEDQRIKHAAGICAACGELVYVSGHTVVSSSSPLGQSLNLDYKQEIDLCPDCSDKAMDGMTTEEESSLALDYLDWWGAYDLYNAERQAIIDAQPEKSWTSLLTNEPFEYRKFRLSDIEAWAMQTDEAPTPDELRTLYNKIHSEDL